MSKPTEPLTEEEEGELERHAITLGGMVGDRVFGADYTRRRDLVWGLLARTAQPKAKNEQP